MLERTIDKDQREWQLKGYQEDKSENQLSKPTRERGQAEEGDKPTGMRRSSKDGLNKSVRCSARKVKAWLMPCIFILQGNQETKENSLNNED